MADAAFSILAEHLDNFGPLLTAEQRNALCHQFLTIAMPSGPALGTSSTESDLMSQLTLPSQPDFAIRTSPGSSSGREGAFRRGRARARGEEKEKRRPLNSFMAYRSK